MQPKAAQVLKEYNFRKESLDLDYVKLLLELEQTHEEKKRVHESNYKNSKKELAQGFQDCIDDVHNILQDHAQYSENKAFIYQQLDVLANNKLQRMLKLHLDQLQKLHAKHSGQMGTSVYRPHKRRVQDLEEEFQARGSKMDKQLCADIEAVVRAGRVKNKDFKAKKRKYNSM